MLALGAGIHPLWNYICWQLGLKCCLFEYVGLFCEMLLIIFGTSQTLHKGTRLGTGRNEEKNEVGFCGFGGSPPVLFFPKESHPCEVAIIDPFDTTTSFEVFPPGLPPRVPQEVGALPQLIRHLAPDPAMKVLTMAKYPGAPDQLPPAQWRLTTGTHPFPKTLGNDLKFQFSAFEFRIRHSQREIDVHLQLSAFSFHQISLVTYV